MYTSGLASGFPLLSNMLNSSFTSHGPFWRSDHLSGMVKGITQVSALAGDASAVAVAMMSTVGTPKNGPISVGTGLALCAVRRTVTCTRLLPLGPAGNVTSAEVTDTLARTTWLARAAPR